MRHCAAGLAAAGAQDVSSTAVNSRENRRRKEKSHPFVTTYYYTEKTPESKSPGSDEEKAVTTK